MTDEQQTELDRLTEAYDGLVGEHGDDPSEVVAAEIETLSEQIDALSRGTPCWKGEDIAIAGAVVGIGHAGRLAVERGLVRPEDMPQAGERGDTPRGEGRGKSKAPRRENGALPAPLVEDLTAHRTAALRAVLAGNTDVALASVVHATALPFFYGPFDAESCLSLRLDSAELRGSAEGIEDSRAMSKLAEHHGFWHNQLPEAAEGLWDWLLAQDTATRLDLLAYCAACSVDAVIKPHERAKNGRVAHAYQLATALNLDMTQWWQPNAASYLNRVPKARILEAVSEGVSPSAAENLAKLKKDALVAQAGERLVGTGWLPAILRTPLPVVAEPASEATAAE